MPFEVDTNPEAASRMFPGEDERVFTSTAGIKLDVGPFKGMAARNYCLECSITPAVHPDEVWMARATVADLPQKLRFLAHTHAEWRLYLAAQLELLDAVMEEQREIWIADALGPEDDDPRRVWHEYSGLSADWAKPKTN